MRLYATIFFIMFLFSCKTKKSNKNTDNNLNVVTESLSQLNEAIVKDYVILIPQNSCSHCRNYIYDNYNKLREIKNLEIVYLKYGDTLLKPEKVKSIKTIYLEPIEKKYDLYGITLYKMDSGKIIYSKALNPSNISGVLDSLLVSSHTSLMANY